MVYFKNTSLLFNTKLINKRKKKKRSNENGNRYGNGSRN